MACLTTAAPHGAPSLKHGEGEWKKSRGHCQETAVSPLNLISLWPRLSLICNLLFHSVVKQIFSGTSSPVRFLSELCGACPPCSQSPAVRNVRLGSYDPSPPPPGPNAMSLEGLTVYSFLGETCGTWGSCCHYNSVVSCCEMASENLFLDQRSIHFSCSCF